MYYWFHPSFPVLANCSKTLSCGGGQTRLCSIVIHIVDSTHSVYLCQNSFFSPIKILIKWQWQVKQVEAGLVATEYTFAVSFLVTESRVLSKAAMHLGKSLYYFVSHSREITWLSSGQWQKNKNIVKEFQSILCKVIQLADMWILLYSSLFSFLCLGT